MFHLKSNVLKSIPTQGGLCRKANSMISWPISRPPWSISQPRWSISGPDGRFPNPMVDFPTLMVNFPTLMVDFLTLMVDFPTLMVRLPTPMVDFPKNTVVTACRHPVQTPRACTPFQAGPTVRAAAQFGGSIVNRLSGPVHPMLLVRQQTRNTKPTNTKPQNQKTPIILPSLANTTKPQATH